jgi:guanosine-3',5'-bis(diphosphate) 3'-pyrophosphohydrolase
VTNVADDKGTAIQPPTEPLQLADIPPSGEPGIGLKAPSSASRRVRARLARRMTAQRSTISPVLEPLVAVHREIYPKADLTLLQRAYEVAEQRHASQLRHSGDPYITHPLAVANILAELGMDTTTLVAALLHDTVEDTGYSLEALSQDFGDEVGHLVDGVTKLDRVVLGSAAEGETIRKMITAMARDPRVLVIKVADRLHNMRTMRFLPPEKQARKARETLEVIAPLAHRLGMATVKWELEDLSFAILHPKKYEEIVRLVAGRAPSRDTYLAKVRAEIVAMLTGSKISAVVEGRPKHYWSIYQKMIVKGRDFDDIHDLVGIRILCDETRDCYAAVGVVHSLWQPMAGRFKDYIAQPRYGVYQSLHTTVVGPEGKPLEVQIRTSDMHRTAEYGIASHWRYKETKGRNGVPHLHASAEIDDMAWMRQLLDWQREAADPGEFLESLRYDLAVQELFVFTPKGDVITLPTGSTPVDFAYAVHTEVGHRCIGARVNGRLVALERKLENGEVVEVFTSKATTAGPSRDWQQFVVSPRAKTKIRQWFAKERREEALETGKDAITREVRRGGLPLQRLVNGGSMAALANELHYADVSARLRQACGATTAGRARRNRPGRGGSGRALDADDGPAPSAQRRCRGVRAGRCGRSDQIGQVLHAGTGRRDPGFRHPRRGSQRAPHRLHQRHVPAAAVRTDHRGALGAVTVVGVFGGHSGRGARPAPAAVRRDSRAGRRAGEHPVGIGDHLRR